MKKHAQHTLRTTLLSFLALVSGYLFLSAISSKRYDTKLNIRIFTPTPADSLRLRRLHLKDVLARHGGRYIDAAVSEQEYHAIKSKGFAVRQISPVTTNPAIPAAYMPLETIEDEVSRLRRQYPGLCHVERIGVSTSSRLPIWGIKISDNASQKEDEPRILFAGVHHAREPIGANICLKLMDTLLRKYGRDKRVTRWVDSIEIWFVPVVNPDGYKYMFDHNLRFPWWRKNLRDNDGDRVFNPLFDGVDLNRNYDFNWTEGGDGKPSSWFYRGGRPFSENETRAIMQLSLRENFAIGISYHSYGESILFPWGNYKRPPDLDLIVDIASKMASRIKRQSGHGNYSILPLNGRVGQSSVWMYGHLKVIDYIVEVGTEYFPADAHVPFILKENTKGAFYLFDRLLETGIKGHVFDRHTRRPLLADIRIRRFTAKYVNPRRTDADTGSFYRLVNPGEYTVEISSRGYHPKTFYRVRVRKNQFVAMEIGLVRKDKYSNGRN
ncbi:MAG: M14 family zinc carboxypeptidase [bacterium]